MNNQLNKYIFLFHGYSGSGKSEACKYMEEEYGFINIHPIRFIKNQLEEHYGLPYGFSDTPEGKRYKPEGANSTIQEIMVDTYHFWEKHDPLYSMRDFKPRLIRSINQKSVTLQAVRNKTEIDFITDITRIYEIPFVYCELLRDTSKQETSESNDVYNLIKSTAISAAHRKFTIDNNSDNKEDLYKSIDKICIELGVRKNG